MNTRSKFFSFYSNFTRMQCFLFYSLINNVDKSFSSLTNSPNPWNFYSTHGWAFNWRQLAETVGDQLISQVRQKDCPKCGSKRQSRACPLCQKTYKNCKTAEPFQKICHIKTYITNSADSWYKIKENSSYPSDYYLFHDYVIEKRNKSEMWKKFNSVAHKYRWWGISGHH